MVEFNDTRFRKLNSHGRGRRFKPCIAHHFLPLSANFSPLSRFVCSTCLESIEITVNQRFCILGKRQVFRVQHPVRDQAVYQRMQPHRREPWVNRRGEQALFRRVAQATLDISQTLGTTLDVTRPFCV